MMTGSRKQVASRKLLVINPNTNRAVTDRIRTAAESVALDDTVLHVINPVAGPFAIETPEDRREAVPHVLTIINRSTAAGYDGYILACFDDIGVAEARMLVPTPVISLAEAGITEARRRFVRFAVVTTVKEAVPTIEGLVSKYDAADFCTVMATGIGVTDASARTAQAEEAISATIRRCRDEGAEAIVLGSGAYAGRQDDLTRSLRVPVIDGLNAAISRLEGAATRHE